MKLKSKAEIIRYIEDHEIPDVNENIQKMINIIPHLKEIIINSETDPTWSYFKSKEELLSELDAMIQEFKEENLIHLIDLNIDFTPPSGFQEIAINSGWS